MTLRNKLLGGAVVLTSWQFAVNVLAFIRNIIVARLLTPENMGIAAIFAITTTFFEIVSNLAVDMLIVQAKEGDDPTFQGLAHLFKVFRGLFVGCIIFACAPLIVGVFTIPQAEWAVRYIALVPIFNGFMHLDMKRMERDLNYRPGIIVELVPQVFSTLIAFPMATWCGDYSAVLWLLLIQGALRMLISHAVAQRPYRMNWNRHFASRIINFGWPLLINGLLMFGAIQGDRVIVGRYYSMTELGVYSVAFLIAIHLANAFSKVNITLLLPTFSKVQNELRRFRNRYLAMVQIASLIGGFIAIPFVTAGGTLIVLIYGKQYTAAASLAPWLGIFLLFRIFRQVPTVACLARGDTKNSMIANIFRFVGVVAALIAGLKHCSLSVIIMCGIGGELLAYVSVIYRLNKFHSVNYADSIFAPAVVLLILVIANLNNMMFIEHSRIVYEFELCMLYYVILLAVATSCFPIVRLEVQRGAVHISKRIMARLSQ